MGERVTKDQMAIEAVARSLCSNIMGPPDYIVPEERSPLWVRFIPHAYDAIEAYKEFMNAKPVKVTR